MLDPCRQPLHDLTAHRLQQRQYQHRGTGNEGEVEQSIEDPGGEHPIEDLHHVDGGRELQQINHPTEQPDQNELLSADAQRFVHWRVRGWIVICNGYAAERHVSPAGRPVSPAGVSECEKPDALLVRLWLTPSTSTMKHVQCAATVRLLTANARPCTTRSHRHPGQLRHTEQHTLFSQLEADYHGQYYDVLAG